MTTSISVAPSITHMAVSATFTSMNVCEAGNPADTAAMPTGSVRVAFTVETIDGNTQMAPTLGMSGKFSSKLFTFSTIDLISSSVSVSLSEVRSMLLKQRL